MWHNNKGTLAGSVLREEQVSSLCPCSRVLQYFSFKTVFLFKTHEITPSRMPSSACEGHAHSYYYFFKGSWLPYPQLHCGLVFAQEVATSLSYSSAGGCEFVQAEEDTEYKSNLLDK